MSVKCACGTSNCMIEIREGGHGVLMITGRDASEHAMYVNIEALIAISALCERMILVLQEEINESH